MTLKEEVNATMRQLKPSGLVRNGNLWFD